jgi:hypothetical protein
MKRRDLLSSIGTIAAAWAMSPFINQQPIEQRERLGKRLTPPIGPKGLTKGGIVWAPVGGAVYDGVELIQDGKLVMNVSDLAIHIVDPDQL